MQPGQRLLIGAPIFGVDGTPLEAYPLVRRIAQAAYQAGAKYVAVNWDDEELQRIRVQNGAADTMGEFATWNNEVAVNYIENGDAIMIILAQNPDLMGDLEAGKVQAKQQTEAEHFQKMFSLLATGDTNWLCAGAPIASWAAKVFPELEGKKAIDQMWETIFAVCRVSQDDPVAVWQRYITELARRSGYLNGKRYAALHYSAPGTDLTVGLPEGHVWHSGSLTSRSGITYVANLPTEEVFTMPHKRRIDGTVSSTKPLSYGGSLIDNFRLTFKAGRVVKATAETGQIALDNLLNSDDASRSLGEVALVPHSSPISQSGLLFYNIIFNENASSHLALGKAYRFSMEEGEGMSAEEFGARGGNESMTHADYMIGSADMNVDGISTGGTEPVIRYGEWAFVV